MSEEETKELNREVKLEIIVTEEKDNPLLRRREISAIIKHDFGPTPDRLDIKAKIAAKYGVSADTVIIKQMKNHFGASQEFLTAYIYESLEVAKKIEHEYMIIRNMPKELRKDAIKAMKAKKKKKKKKEA